MIDDENAFVAEVRQLADQWYRMLDEHAPAAEVLALLAADGLEFELPEGTLRGAGEFVQWYEGVIRLFFDERHELERFDVQPSGDGAEVSLVVHWQARRWRPPAARSDWLDFDAVQRWVVVRSADTGKPVIRSYVVQALNPRAGSAAL